MKIKDFEKLVETFEEIKTIKKDLEILDKTKKEKDKWLSFGDEESNELFYTEDKKLWTR